MRAPIVFVLTFSVFVGASSAHAELIADPNVGDTVLGGASATLPTGPNLVFQPGGALFNEALTEDPGTFSASLPVMPGATPVADAGPFFSASAGGGVSAGDPLLNGGLAGGSLTGGDVPTVSAVPLPAPLLLLLSGIAALRVLRRRA